MSARAYFVYEPYIDDFSFGLMIESRASNPLFLTKLVLEEGMMGDYREPLRHKDIGAPVREIAQAILDAAWDAGLRPNGFSDVKNETVAIRAHLNDMRCITFAKLNIKEPPK